MNLVTTHDWSMPVDVDHLCAVRADLGAFAVGGVQHLVLEVIAYALDEAVEGATTRIDVEARADGSLCISDDGRGTDTRIDGRGSEPLDLAQFRAVLATVETTAALTIRGDG